MLQEGLLIAGFSVEKQARQPKTFETFKAAMAANRLFSAVSGKICRLGAPHESARIPVKRLKLSHFFQIHQFLKQCPKESELKAACQQRTQTIRDNVWCHVERICALKTQKIHIPANHLTGDNIRICTVDGMMSAACERAKKNTVKDPVILSFEHHAGGTIQRLLF